MTDRNNPFSERCWRFVDGELNVEQENAFVASCEAEPDCYRELALALIERNRLAEMLADLNSPAEPNQPAPVTKAGYKPMVAKGNHQENSNAMWRWLPTLAATLLIGMFVGYASPHPLKDVPVNNSVPDSIAASEDDDEARTTSKLASPAPRMNTANTVQPAVASERMLQDEETLISLARRLKPTPTLNDQTVQMLRDSGLSVDRRNHIFLFEAADGYQIAIPAEFTFLRSDSK